MGAEYISSIFEISDLVSMDLQGEDKTQMAVIGSLKDKKNTYPAEYWTPFGIASMPVVANPNDPEGSAQTLSINMTGRNLIIGTRDMRNQSNFGNLGYGDTVLYSGGQGRCLLKNDGSASLYTAKGNVAGGSSSTLQLLPTGEINLGSEFGGLAIKDGNFTLMSKSSAMQMSNDGINMAGKTIVLNGSIVLGDATATGVATQLSQTAFITSLVATTAAMQLFLNSPLIAAFSAGTAQGAAAAMIALGVTAALPTNYSLNVKAS